MSYSDDRYISSELLVYLPPYCVHPLIYIAGYCSEIMTGSSPKVSEIRGAQRAEGCAAMLAIGTANPANQVSQEEYPYYYFRVTKSEHLTDHKDTFKIICKHPNILKYLSRHV